MEIAIGADLGIPAGLCVKVVKKTTIFGVGVGLFISLSGGLSLFRKKQRRAAFGGDGLNSALRCFGKGFI